MEYEYENTFLTEKDSQVQALAVVTNADYRAKWQPAYNKKDKTALVPLQGHVLVGKEPHEYDEKYAGFGEDKIYVFPEKYELKPGYNEGILNNAVEHLQKSKNIIIATDYDNEGASIAMNVIKYAGVEDRVQRMIPMGSTHPIELKKAIDNPIDIPYKNMADAGMARAFIDWAEGMSLSRALTHFLGDKGSVKLNFGGVKTPLIYIVVARDLAYENHEMTYYWTANGAIEVNGKEVPVKLKHKVETEDAKGNKKNVFEEKFDSQEAVTEAIEYLKDRELEIGTLTRKKSKTLPPELYELAGLQASMNDEFNLTPTQAMEVAQKLYDFPVSLQTYPRTDVPYLKKAEHVDVEPILKKLKEHSVIEASIIDNILSGPIPKRPSTFNDKEVVAHGAIVPTLEGDLGKWLSGLNKQEAKMFELIAKRYTVNFMDEYEYLAVSGKTKEDNGYIFTFGENIPKKAGWKILTDKSIESEINTYEPLIPESLSVGDKVKLSKINDSKHETKPKPLFTMKTLLKAMKNISSLFPENKDIKTYLGDEGIGTNATRAGIIDQVMSVEKNKGEPWLIEDKKKIRSTKKARELIKAIPTQLVSPLKRAMLSKKLKQVEKGELKAVDLINEYRTDIENNIKVIKEIFEEKGPIAASAKSEAMSLGPCPVCNKDVIEKAKVYLCSGAKFKKDENDKWTNEGCEYKIFKTALDRFGKKNVTAREVSNLLHKGKAKVSLKAKKSGKTYTADIVPDNKWGLKVEFNF